MQIEDFSAQSLQYVFVNHISQATKVITDTWRGYKSIAKAFSTKPIEVNKVLNFKALYALIDQVILGIEQSIYGVVIVLEIDIAMSFALEYTALRAKQQYSII